MKHDSKMLVFEEDKRVSLADRSSWVSHYDLLRMYANRRAEGDPDIFDGVEFGTRRRDSAFLEQVVVNKCGVAILIDPYHSSEKVEDPNAYLLMSDEISDGVYQQLLQYNEAFEFFDRVDMFTISEKNGRFEESMIDFDDKVPTFERLNRLPDYVKINKGFVK